jgi:hypothetical protein
MVSIRETSAMSAVDTLFGLVADLWPIIHRLSTLYRMKTELEKEEMASPGCEKATEMRGDFENNASTVELALHQWTPKIPASLVTTETLPTTPVAVHSQQRRSIQAGLFHFSQPKHLRPPAQLFQIRTPTKQALQACLRVVIFSDPCARYCGHCSQPLVRPLMTSIAM